MRTTLLLLFAAFLVACGSGDSVERIVKVYPNGNPERMVIYDASETNIIGEKFFYDDGGVRVSAVHYNSSDDIARACAVLDDVL